MNTALVIANIGVLVVNLFLIYFIYRQVRHIYRPVITTKVISREASVEDIPTTLISENPYLVVSNESTNQATRLRISYEFWLQNRRIVNLSKSLGYLNPKEAMREPLPLGEIIRNHSELFEQVEQGKETKKIPKKTLALYLKINISHGFPRHRIADTYKIEWGSLENYPRFEDHPMINCWNMRDELYIYKLGRASDTKR
jgi:hypothetical protein